MLFHCLSLHCNAAVHVFFCLRKLPPSLQHQLQQLLGYHPILPRSALADHNHLVSPHLHPASSAIIRPHLRRTVPRSFGPFLRTLSSKLVYLHEKETRYTTPPSTRNKLPVEFPCSSSANQCIANTTAAPSSRKVDHLICRYIRKPRGAVKNGHDPE